MSDVLHQHLSPIVIIVTGSAGNLEQTIPVVVTAISGIAAIQIGIILRTHAASATPAFISDTKIFHLPRLFAPVFLSQFCHRATLFRGHIFHPLGHFFHASATYVSTDVRFTSQHFAQIQEFMRTETVIFHGTPPIVVDHARTFITRPNTVHPVVFIGKASSRPTEHRHFQGFQRLEHVFTIPVDVRYRRIFSHPETSINTGTQMFGKLPVDFFVDDLFSLLRMNSHSRLLLSKQRHRGKKSQP